jgi:transposase-like protein
MPMTIAEPVRIETLRVALPHDLADFLRSLAADQGRGVADVVASLVGEEARRRGRLGHQHPKKMTPAVRAALCRLLREGYSRTAAAERCGVSRQTLYYWLRHHDDFAQALEAAEAEEDRVAAGAVLRRARRTTTNPRTAA